MGPAPDLLAVLDEAQQAGFLGAAPVERHVTHALAFTGAVPDAPSLAIDLGSGGGLPGLVLADAWPTSRWTFVDRSARRCAFLRRAVAGLGLAGRVAVEQAPAEQLGADPAWRHQHDLVVARSFGPPAVTAECGAPFLREEGRLAVAEPPEAGSRWPVEGLALLGLEPALRWRDGASIQVLAQVRLCPARYPRRPGVPARRPLW